MLAWMLEEVVKTIVAFGLGVFLKGLTEGNTMTESKKCLIAGCARPAVMGKRGLCLLCHAKAKQKVQSGDVTWDKLVEKGLCLPDADPFDDAYSRAMEDQ